MDRSFIIPIAVAAGVHSLLFVSGKPDKATPPPPQPAAKAIEWDIRDLIPPEPPDERTPDDKAAEHPASPKPTPVSAELLTIRPNPDDFIQKGKLADLRPHPSSDISRIESGWESIRQAGEPRSVVFDPTLLDNPPATRFQPAPTYPRDLRTLGCDGTVTVTFSVDVNGSVYDATVSRASHSSFGEEALRAVRRWRFEPGLKDGKRVPFRMIQTFSFTLPD